MLVLKLELHVQTFEGLNRF